MKDYRALATLLKEALRDSEVTVAYSDGPGRAPRVHRGLGFDDAKAGEDNRELILAFTGPDSDSRIPLLLAERFYVDREQKIIEFFGEDHWEATILVDAGPPLHREWQRLGEVYF